MSKSAATADAAPVSARDASALFADLSHLPCVAIAVSGGPDSMALLWLITRWRKARKRGPKFLAFTVDHGLRREAAGEARGVAKFCKQLGVPHRILKWTGAKPATGIQEAARDARYALMARAAHRAGATHLLTAHTMDDQAETMLFRMARGSGLAGLSGMARASERGGITLMRPLLEVPKARLLATLARAKISFAHDPSNDDPRFTRVRWRKNMPSLAAEGLDAAALARLSQRLSRANAALEHAVDQAAASMSTGGATAISRMSADKLKLLPDEIAIRLLARVIARHGGGDIPLGKLEAKFGDIKVALAGKSLSKPGAGGGLAAKIGFTLAGAQVWLAKGALCVTAAPPRRHLPADKTLNQSQRRAKKSRVNQPVKR